MEAEVVLNEFLKLEPNSEEGKFHLGEAQIMLLCNNGKYSSRDAIEALKLTNYNTSVSRLVYYTIYLVCTAYLACSFGVMILEVIKWLIIRCKYS